MLHDMDELIDKLQTKVDALMHLAVNGTDNSAGDAANTTTGFSTMGKRSQSKCDSVNFEPTAKTVKLEDISKTTPINDLVPSIAHVANAGLLAEHIFPLLRRPMDKLNCMLVCKQWYSQMHTSSAWRHIHTLRVETSSKFANCKFLRTLHTLQIDGYTDTVSLSIMTDSNETAVVPNGHELSLLRLCTNIRTIRWMDCRLSCNNVAVDTLIGSLSEGKLSSISCCFMHSDSLHHDLAQFDRLFSTTFKRVQTIHLKFVLNGNHYTLTPEQHQQMQHDCANAFATMLSHHGHKLRNFVMLEPQLIPGTLCGLMTTLVQAQPTALSVLHVHVGNAEQRQLLIELINQRKGTLTELIVSDRYDRIDWCALLRAIDPHAVRSLQTFVSHVTSAHPDFNLIDTCALLAEKCENLTQLTITRSLSLSLAEFATILHHFTNARKSFVFRCSGAYVPAVGDQEREDYRELDVDRLATALLNQFDAQHFRKVERISYDDLRFQFDNYEFLFKIDKLLPWL